MTDTPAHPSGPDGSDSSADPKPDGRSWEERHIRVTFWLERTLREEVRKAAKKRALSLTQFIAHALRRAVEETK